MAKNGKKKNAQKEGRVNKALVLAAGVAAWAAVAVVAVLIVFNMGGKNQVLMFLPILAAVAAAWTIGELVTGHVFTEHEKGV